MAAKNKNKMNLRQQIAVMGRVLGYMLKNYKFSFLWSLYVFWIRSGYPSRYALHAKFNR